MKYIIGMYAFHADHRIAITFIARGAIHTGNELFAPPIKVNFLVARRPEKGNDPFFQCDCKMQGERVSRDNQMTLVY